MSSLAGWLAGLLEPVPFHSTLFTSFLFHSRGFWVLFLYIHFYLHSFSSVFVHAGSTVFFCFIYTVECACVGSVLNYLLSLFCLFLRFDFLLFRLQGWDRWWLGRLDVRFVWLEFFEAGNGRAGNELSACRILLGLGAGRLILVWEEKEEKGSVVGWFWNSEGRQASG